MEWMEGNASEFVGAISISEKNSHVCVSGADHPEVLPGLVLQPDKVHRNRSDSDVSMAEAYCKAGSETYDNGFLRLTSH